MPNVWDGPFRRFGPLEAGDAGLNETCPAYGRKTQLGEYITLIALETPAEAGSLSVRAAVAHWDCRRHADETRLLSPVPESGGD